MKRIITPFIAAFLIGAVALLAVYVESRVRPHQKSEYLWYDTLQQLNDLARIKHRQSLRYAQYSTFAEKEGLHNQAVLLRAISQADAIQCQNCIKAIESLGGIHHIPVSVDATMYDTRRHMQIICDEKSAYHSEHIHNIILQTLNEGNRYIARMLTWSDASDVEQILILRHELQRSNTADTIHQAHYTVCPVCGKLSDKELSTYRCAHCMTPHEKFLIFK